MPPMFYVLIFLAVLHFMGRLGGDLLFGEWEIAGATLHPLTLIYALSGSAMISTIKVPKI